jgi:hypothetical protein
MSVNNKSGINQLDGPEFQGISEKNIGNNSQKLLLLNATDTHLKKMAYKLKLISH